jgi:integrase
MLMTQLVEDYVALRHATGFQFSGPEKMLHRFASFAAERGEDHVRAETAVAWAQQAEGQQQRYLRIRVVTHFAEFLRSSDPRHEIPPRGVFCPRADRPTPHIFTEKDIAKIVACAAMLGPEGSLRPLVYSTAFGLMAVTGLRRSEATELRMSDLTDDGILIRNSKFRKSRLVPLHRTTADALEQYLQARRKVAGQSDHLFVSVYHRKLSPRTLTHTFHEVCEQAGIGRTLAGKRPRLHDLRHTFAVRALECSPAGRDQVNRHMLALTTYMGHARVESTYWYLERTPELLRDIADACEAFVTGGAS